MDYTPKTSMASLGHGGASPIAYSPGTAALVDQGIDMDSIMRDYQNLMNTLTRTETSDHKPAHGNSSVESGRMAAVPASVGNSDSTIPAVPSSSSSAPVAEGYGMQYSYTAQHTSSKSPRLFEPIGREGGGDRVGGRDSPTAPPAPPPDGMSSLLSALREADRRASLAKEDVAIAKAEGEAAVADARLETQRAQHKMRALASQRGLEEVYAVLEEDASRLVKELGTARAQITALEERASSAEARAACKDIDRETGAGALNKSSHAGGGLHNTTSGSGNAVSPMRMNGRAVAYTLTPSRGGGEGGEESALDSPAPSPAETLGLGLSLSNMSNMSSSSQAAKKEIRRLSARIARYAKDLEASQAAAEELRAQQRTHAIALRQSKDAARRVFLSNQANTRTQAAHEAALTAHAATQQELELVRGEMGALHDQASSARQQANMLQTQLTAALQQVEQYEQLVRQEHKLNRFVRKHVRVDGTNNGWAAGGGSEIHADARPAAAQASFRQTLRKAGTQQMQQQASKQRQDEKQILVQRAAVDSVINDMRAACVFKAPDVLPHLRALVDGLNEERSTWSSLLQGAQHKHLGH